MNYLLVCARVESADKTFPRKGEMSDMREEYDFRVSACFTFEGYCRQDTSTFITNIRNLAA